MKKIIILILLITVSKTSLSQDKIRGSISKNIEKETSIGTNYILTIGVDDYTNWNKLSNAVNDAQGVHDLFSNKLGYVPVSKPLINENATKKSILSLIENKLPSVLTENDNLVIFFSGHGESFERQVGTKTATIGYIIPQDGGHPSKNNFNSYLKADELMSKINELPAKHILLILDACKSGIAVKTQKWRSNTYSEDLRSRMSRKVITSAMSDQVASDDGPIQNHSLFTGTLIDGFTTGMIDKGDRNGLVTTSEIGLYLQQLVAQNSKATIKQTPDFGAFGFDDRGEMVIDLNDDSLFALKAKINGAMQSGNLSNAWKTLEVLNETYPEDPEIDYYEYRKSIYECNIDKAILHANKLQKFIDKSDSKYYLNSGDIWNLKQQLPYWRNILEIKPQNKALKINVRMYPRIDENGYSDKEYSILLHPNIKMDLDIAPYEIKPKSSFTIEVENNSQITQYLYCVAFDLNGSFEIVPLFDDYNVVDSGLPKESKIESYIFVQDGAIGLENICIYSSPERIREFERPMNTNARGASRPLEKFTDFEIMKNDVFLLFK
jgi:hypothetical protein